MATPTRNRIIELDKVCQNWFLEKFDERGTINMSGLSLSYIEDSLFWNYEEFGPALNNAERKVNINLTNNTEEHYCKIKVSKICQEKMKIKLSDIVVTGLNKYVHLPLRKDVPHGSVKIDPGMPLVEESNPEQTVETELETSTLLASSEINVPINYFRGYFSCKLKLTGNVRFSPRGGVTREQNIGSIVEKIQASPGGYLKVFTIFKEPWLRCFEMTTGISWNMNGTYKQSWVSMPQICFK